MPQGYDSLFYEIIRGAHGSGPAARRLYRPFDVGPWVRIAGGTASGARPLAAVAGWVAAKAGSLRRHAVPAGSAASACCQPA